jgi:hypothetical protein
MEQKNTLIHFLEKSGAKIPNEMEQKNTLVKWSKKIPSEMEQKYLVKWSKNTLESSSRINPCKLFLTFLHNVDKIM